MRLLRRTDSSLRSAGTCAPGSPPRRRIPLCPVGWILAVLLAAPGCGGRTASRWTEQCDNGRDDDGDLLVDCADPQCAQDPACTGGALCGNGRIDPGEQCDGADLGGQSCADVIPLSQGVLSCAADCRFDTRLCQAEGMCGDGIVDPGEACDCGQDPDALPPGCAAPNGWEGSPCGDDCTPPPRCGDGRLDPGEACDDGNLLPGDGCSPDCEIETQCVGPSVWEECDPLQPDACCPDASGTPLTCVDVTSTALCQRPCTDTSDCYWSHYCERSLGACWVAACGGDMAGSALDAPCQVPGGGQGWCAPLFERTSPADPLYGICVESGGLPHGAPCTPWEVFAADRSVDQCAQGWCAGDPGQPGRCLQFCNWQEAYDHAFGGGPAPTLPCPAGTNCLAPSYVDPQNGGALQHGISVCLETRATDPVQGVDTCSLVTGALLADPSRTCGDLQPGGRCFLVTWQTGQAADGTLLGVCGPGPANPQAAWDPCTPGSDACPSGTRCTAEDALSANPGGPTRCVPYCDVATHDAPGACASLGAPAAAQCVSFSAPFSPPPGSETSRLGLCVMP